MKTSLASNRRRVKLDLRKIFLYVGLIECAKRRAPIFDIVETRTWRIVDPASACLPFAGAGAGRRKTRLDGHDAGDGRFHSRKRITITNRYAKFPRARASAGKSPDVIKCHGLHPYRETREE
jgi:hypothetical protein